MFKISKLRNPLLSYARAEYDKHDLLAGSAQDHLFAGITLFQILFIPSSRVLLILFSLKLILETGNVDMTSVSLMTFLAHTAFKGPDNSASQWLGSV